MERREDPILIDVVFLTLLLLFYFLGFYSSWPIWEDQSIYHYAAWGLSHGMIPYVDAIDLNFPGIILVHWFAWMFSGIDPLGLRLLDICFLFVLCFSTSVILSSWKVPWPIRLLCISGYILYYFHTHFDQTAQRESFALPLVILGLLPWLAITGEKQTNFWQGVVFGAITGLGLWIKPTPILLVLAVLLLTLSSSQYARTKLRSIGAYLIGMVLVSCCFLVWLWAIGALGGFVKWCILFSLGPYRESVLSWPNRWHAVIEFFDPSRWAIPLYLSLIGGILFIIRGRYSAATRPIILGVGLTVVSLFMALLQGKTYCHYHFIPFLWALSVLAAVLISWAMPTQWIRRSGWIILITVIVVLVMAEWQFAGQRPTMRETDISRNLKILLPKSETVIVYGFSPALLMTLEKRTPFPFMASAYMYEFSISDRAFREEIRNAFVGALANPSVRYLIVERNYGIIDSLDKQRTKEHVNLLDALDNQHGQKWLNARGFFINKDFPGNPGAIYDIYERRNADGNCPLKSPGSY